MVYQVPTTYLVEKISVTPAVSACLTASGSITFPQELVTRPCDPPGEYSTRHPTYHIRQLKNIIVFKQQTKKTHINKIYFIIYYYLTIFFSPLCDHHHGVPQKYKIT